MVGSVTERVLRKASCPVLAVHKPSYDFLNSRESDPAHLNRILFCTDFSDNSLRALSHALSLTAHSVARVEGRPRCVHHRRGDSDGATG
jgi:nucleotide-binding universal stress UspA family protein